ncbi:MAG: PorV/PorQ family protein [Rikenellaceae bacterium]
MIKKVLTFAVALSCSLSAFAQTDFLSLSGDVASAALAGTNGAYNSSSFAVTENMSAVGMSDKQSSVGVNMVSWQPSYINSTIFQAGGFHKLSDQLSIGASLQYESLVSQDIINDLGESEGSFTPNGMSLNVGAAYALSEHLAVGASLSYISSTLYTLKSSFVGVNLSTTYSVDGTTLAAAINNLGSEDEVIAAPMNFTVSAAHSFVVSDSSKVGLMGSACNILAPTAIASWSFGGAIELDYQSKLFVRAGYRSCDPLYMDSYTSCGVGVALNDIRVDASYLIGASSAPINGTFMIGLTWSK